MPKLAKGRDVYLTRGEIALAALGQFDTVARPLSMRLLAKSLGVAPASIYHYFPTEEAVIRAAVALVFDEAVQSYLAEQGNPLEQDHDPMEFLIGSALHLRRAFLRHYRIAPYMASSPRSSRTMSGVLAIYGAALEGLGLYGQRAGEAMYAFGHYVYGAILVTASRRIADERFSDHPPFSSADRRPDDAPATSPETASALDDAFDTATDEAADEQLFVTGLRMLLEGIRVMPLDPAEAARR